MPLMSNKPLLVDNCGQLLTLQGANRPRRGREMGDAGVIRQGAILIRNGLVEAVGPARRVRRHPRARGATRLDAAGQVVMPGFVDSHTHALFVGSRVGEYVARIRGATYEELARAGEGIQSSANTIRTARLPV